MENKKPENNEDKLKVESVLKISKKLPKAFILQGTSCARCDAGSTCSERGSLGCS